MILQEEFKKYGYKDILIGENASEYGIDLEEIFDVDMKPEELLHIFISQQRDELFFTLNGDLMEVNSLCERWDNKIRVFSIINGRNQSFKKLKYNIVLLIIYSENEPDERMEGNLLVSRKIIIQGDLSKQDNIIIDENEVIDLPFHMIPPDAFKPDIQKLKRLNQLIPQDEELSKFMKSYIKKNNGTVKNKVRVKSLKVQEYTSIKEWLEDDIT